MARSYCQAIRMIRFATASVTGSAAGWPASPWASSRSTESVICPSLKTLTSKLFEYQTLCKANSTGKKITMDTVASADGTAIAFDRYGDGPPVIMAVAAFNTRSATDPLARALAPRFSVLNYDRRGRGDSGDTTPYAVDREIDDLAALIAAAGGS